jgi:hypothetical protein
MHSLTYIYSRLVSLLGLSVRLGLFFLVASALIAIVHCSGVWDVQNRYAPPPPFAAFVALARQNPLTRLEAVTLGNASFYQEFLRIAGQTAPARPRSVPAHAETWRLLWQWLAAPSPLTHNPYPHLRAARQQETHQALRLVFAYYLSNLLAAALVGISGVLGWALLQGMRALLRWPGRHGTPRLSEHRLQRTPVRLPVPRGRLASLPWPRSLLAFAASSRTARQILSMLAAHKDWPASLSHHGDHAGGLLAHTLRAYTLACAHPGAQDPQLRHAFLLTVLAHDIGKVLAYAPRPSGGYAVNSYYHANKSADLLVAAGVFTEFASAHAEAILVALRASAARSLVPIPENAPAAAATLLTWLTEVDQQAVSQDVADLKHQVEQADVRSLLPTLFGASAPSAELPAPLYRDGGSPYLLREPARIVLLQLLGLQHHPGARATTGRRDPVWERLKQELQEAGVSQAEIRIALPSRQRPFQALAIPSALLDPEAHAASAQQG